MFNMSIYFFICYSFPCASYFHG